LMERHVVPMMSRIQSRPEAAGAIDHVLQYGDAPDAPEVSVVVPIYTHIQHLEAQLAEFADDPAMQRADLVYVLDSPEQTEAMRHLASNLFPVYQLPFRVAVLERNSGFAEANNAGASVARGRLLLLLNSDVLPDRPGWLETMSRFYDATPDIGALAPKLIYEDDSIQHAGMYLYRPPGSSLWIDAHYWKGLHRSFEAANVTRPVPAVSGACMMIERALYEELGGLSGHYVRGDYEDFDICLRLLERGRQSWYLSEVELYHLEGQSYSTDLRLPANSFNAWLHTQTWRATIEELMSGEMGRPDWSG
jgi:GT2 family glycosyltransferase